GINLNVIHEYVKVDTDAKIVTVRNLETNVKFEDSYDKLMIATGASSIIPPIKNVKLENVSTLKTMEDGIKVKELLNKEENKKIDIIGDGFIGIEDVVEAKRLGKEGMVFELEDISVTF